MTVRDVVFTSGVDRSDAINAAAEQYSLPARVIVAQAIAESNLTETAERWGRHTDAARQALVDMDYERLHALITRIQAETPDDISFGPFQQTVRWAPIGDQTHSIENVLHVRQVFTRDFAYALDVAAQPLGRHWAKYGPDGAETMGRYNWPSRGLQGNPNAAHIKESWEASARYEVGDMPSERQYDPDFPPERQVQDWTCSIRTATWMLRSIGIDTDGGRMQDAMVPRLVTPALGLLDGSGSQLSTFLADRVRDLGAEAWSKPHIGWQWLQEWAGADGPIGIGSSALYHWVAVRKRNADGTIALMNPAPGYRGLGDTLTEADFHRWAPWNAVYIDLPAAPEETEDDPVIIAELQRIAQDVAMPDVAKALAHIETAQNTKRLPAAARDALQTAHAALQAGVRPALATIARGGAPE